MLVSADPIRTPHGSRGTFVRITTKSTAILTVCLNATVSGAISVLLVDVTAAVSPNILQFGSGLGSGSGLLSRQTFCSLDLV